NAVPIALKPCRNHCSLTFIEMASCNVLADHECKRFSINIRIEINGSWVNADRAAGSIPVAPVKYHAVKQRNRLTRPVDPDGGDESVEVGTFEQREGIREWMKFHGAHWASSQKGMLSLKSSMRSSILRSCSFGAGAGSSLRFFRDLRPSS